MLVYFVTESHGKSVKIQIDCDDILKILAGLTNQEYKIPETPIEITKVIAQVGNDGKLMRNPYHPEDSTDSHFVSTLFDVDKTQLPSQWQVKHEVEMDLMKAEIEKKLDRENRNFIAKPPVISEDELEIVDNQTAKMDNKIDILTEDYYYLKLLQNNNDGNSNHEVDKKDNIVSERKKEIDAVVIENNAVLVGEAFDKKNLNQKRFQLSKSNEGERNDKIRNDYSSIPQKTRMVLSDEERARRPSDTQDFKDFQRRFILVDGPEKKKIS